MDLFAGTAVSDLARSQDWYERLLGGAPAFFPNDVEAVWELDEHRYLYVVVQPEHAGHGRQTLFLDDPADLEARCAAASTRGVEPARREEYDNGVRKVTYRDPDGNEIGFAGGPTSA